MNPNPNPGPGPNSNPKPNPNPCPTPGLLFILTPTPTLPPGLSLIANSPNKTTMELFTTAPDMTIPGLRWGAHAYDVKAKLPKLILYSRTELNGTTYYAWEPLQKDLQAKCTLEALNCTLS